MGGDSVDFFVSHAGADRAWAEWVAWQLIQTGYSVDVELTLSYGFLFVFGGFGGIAAT